MARISRAGTALRGPFPWITAAVSLASIALYAVAAAGLPLSAVTGGDPLDLGHPLHIVGLGARSTALIADAGEVWRLLTCHLVHTSALHLAFNLAFFFPVGGALEQVTRRTDYAALLLTTGVASAVASLIGTPQVSAGSSGLVFGVLGAAVSFGLRHRQRLGRRVRPYFGAWVLPFLLIVLAMGIGNPLVDQASHVGGLVCGVAVGAVLEPVDLRVGSYNRPQTLGYAAAAFALAMLAGAPFVARRGQPDHRYELESGVAVTIPASWRPRYGPLGELEFVTAGGMVVFTTDRAPAGSAEQLRAWYDRHRLSPLAPSGRAQGLRTVELAEVLTPHGRGHRVRYALRRDNTPMVRDVYFVTGSAVGAPTTVISLETPLTWTGPYAETRAEILGSMEMTATPTLSAAALQ